MSTRFFIPIVFLLLSPMTAADAQEYDVNFATLSGRYLGQTPPGMAAEVFAPFLNNVNGYLGCSGFLNNGTVFVYTLMVPGTDWRFRPTYVTELKDGAWTTPTIAPFSSYLPYNFTVGPAGKIIYFTTMKSPDKTTSQLLESSNIWVVYLNENGWTEPLMLGASINTVDYYENYPTVASNGTVYYMSRREDGVGRTDIYFSENIDGKYGSAQNIGSTINTEGSDQDPFVAPDEGYIIYCQSKPGGYGEYDLYVSFKQEDGSWSPGINMGENVNSTEYEFRPYVTPDGKYLFFTSNRTADHHEGGIFWVDANVIEQLKPEHLQSER